FVAQAPMSGNHDRTAFLTERNHLVQNVVQCCNLALHTAAGLHINKGITGGVENIPGDEHVGTAKMDNAASIRRSVGFPEKLNAFAVMEFSAAALRVRVRGPALGRRWSRLACGRAHAIKNVDVGNDCCADTGIAECSEIASIGFRVGTNRVKLRISTGVVGMETRIEYKLNWLVT